MMMKNENNNKYIIREEFERRPVIFCSLHLSLSSTFLLLTLL